MIRSRRHPWVFALLIALLASSLVFEPVFAAAGTTHETTHALAGAAQGHAEDHHHHDGDDPVAPDHGDDPWHALLHTGHCCGHVTALGVVSADLGLVPAHCAPVPSFLQRPQAGSPSPLLRPPIAG